MPNEEKKNFRFSSKKAYSIEPNGLNTRTIVDVEYSSKTKINAAERLYFCTELNNYMDAISSNKIGNIVDIVSKIREITNSLEERRLVVRISKTYSGEYAYYKNGHIESCGAYEEVWDGEFLVFVDEKGTEVKFKKDRFCLDSEEKVTLINQKLSSFYKTVIALNTMIKRNEELKKEGNMKTLKIEESKRNN